MVLDKQISKLQRALRQRDDLLEQIAFDLIDRRHNWGPADTKRTLNLIHGARQRAIDLFPTE